MPNKNRSATTIAVTIAATVHIPVDPTQPHVTQIRHAAQEAQQVEIPGYYTSQLELVEVHPNHI